MKKIPFNKIPAYLVTHEGLNIFGGKIYIKKKLLSIIGEIPVYGFEICRPEQDTKPVVISTMEELNNYTTINNDGFIPRCMECDSLPVDTGYYYDAELITCVCSYECAVKYMNRLFGKGAWKVEHDKEHNKSVFYVVKENQGFNENIEYRRYGLNYNGLPKERVFNDTSEIVDSDIFDK